MEIIRLSSYTDQEKVSIAEGYLVPRQVRENGLRPAEISFARPALFQIVHDYTREAGVRNLERHIGAICRKVATQVAAGPTDVIEVTTDTVVEWLGKPTFFDQDPGADGHAWAGHRPGMDACGRAGALCRGYGHARQRPANAHGATRQRHEGIGNGRPQLRASRGPRIQRQPRLVQTAQYPHPRSRWRPTKGWPLCRPGHCHCPDLTGHRPLRRRGYWHDGRNHAARPGDAHGGVREKVLAAHRHGLDTVILPTHNEADLEDVPTNVRDQMTFQFAHTIEDAWTLALRSEVKQLPPAGLDVHENGQDELQVVAIEDSQDEPQMSRPFGFPLPGP